jgi:hypothetical protein
MPDPMVPQPTTPTSIATQCNAETGGKEARVAR